MIPWRVNRLIGWEISEQEITSVEKNKKWHYTVGFRADQSFSAAFLSLLVAIGG